MKAQFGTTGNPGLGGTSGQGGWTTVTQKNNNNNFVVTATGKGTVYAATPARSW